MRKSVSIGPTVISSTPDLLYLIERTNPLACKETQVSVNSYLAAISNADVVFIAWSLPYEDHGMVQVFGNTILERDVEFLLPIHVEKSGPRSSIIAIDHVSLEEALSPLVANFPKYLQQIRIPDGGHSGVKGVIYFGNCPHLSHSLPKIDEALRYLSPVLLATFKLWHETTKRLMYQKLISLFESVYHNVGDLEHSPEYICQETQKLMRTERCSLFVVSEDGKYLVAKVFEGLKENLKEECKIPVTDSISGCALVTDRILISNDAQRHPLFYKRFDAFAGKTTKNVLVLPIRDASNRVIGVTIMTNKPGGFTRYDEDTVKPLPTFFGISMMQDLVNKRIRQGQLRVQIANELLMYHMNVADSVVREVADAIFDITPKELMDWHWVCRDVEPDLTPKIALFMFEHLGFIESCEMSKKTLAKFILLARKFYRDVPYHNWMHAFSAAHFAFCLLSNLKLIANSYLTELEGVALLVASMCHDLDHRGETSSFQLLIKSPLISLYNTEDAILERHHFAQTMNVLTECNIFENFDPATYRRVITVMRDIILATDVCVALKNSPMQQAVIMSYDPNRREHRHYLLTFFANICDLNDQVKNWNNSKIAAGLLYEEFFEQGDRQKAMNVPTSPVMDRFKADIPTLQVQFLTDMCLPMFQRLLTIFPSTEPCVIAIEENIRKWKRAEIWWRRRSVKGMTFLSDPTFDLFVHKSKNK